MENSNPEKNDVLTPVIISTLIAIALIVFNIYSYINNNDYSSISEDGDVFIYVFSAIVTFLFLRTTYNIRTKVSKNKDEGIGRYIIAGIIISPVLAAFVIEVLKASYIIGVVVTSAIIVIGYVFILSTLLKSS